MSKQIQKNCIYCGTNKDMTVEHIPPKALFPEPRPSNMLTVPCCKKCNESFSLDDEYFRTVLVNCASVHPYDQNVQAVNKKLLRSMKRQEAAAMSNSILRSIQIVDVISPGGIYLGRNPAMQVNGNRVGRVTDKITQGLFYIIQGYSMPDEYEVTSAFKDTTLSIPNELIDEYGKFWEKPITIGNNIFNYTYAKCYDDPNIMIIIYWFYNKLWLVGFITPKK